jgi:16S rRNA (guanine(527)-N(7))-methyltransferase RsmG
MAEPLQDLVTSGLIRHGLPPNDAAVAALCGYVELLERWGKRINLTGQPEARAIVERQLPDGLQLAALLRRWDPPITSLVDAGAGAGLVGLVVALLCPETHVQLVESNGRRCSFLRTAAHQLQLGDAAQLLEGRLETVTFDAPELLGARATWPVDRWLELAWPRVAPGARVLAFLAGDAPPPPPPQLQLERRVSYDLEDGSPRQLVFYLRLDVSTPDRG